MCGQTFRDSDYSDATPDVTATYNRLGQLLTASQSGAATAPDTDYSFGYHPESLRFASETIAIDPDGNGPLPSLTRTIDRSRDQLQRPSGYQLKTENLTLETSIGYGYDVSGRLATLSAQGLPNLPGKDHAFEYTYEPGSSLIDKVTGPVHEVDNTYETNRNVLSEKKNTRTVGTPGDLSVIGYTVNRLGQREQRNLSGEIRAEFYGGQAADLYPTEWGYDALGQVTSEDKPSTAADRGYSYDQIGNRLTSTADNVTTSYESNELNQYSEISVPSVQSVVPIHDQDGNMTTGLLNGSTTGEFEYDAANQLIRTQTTATSDPTRYAYDAFGRRIAKVTYPNGSDIASAANVFLYDGWNLIAEYKLDAGAWSLDRTYTWGIDLSGSTQGAGGVGGLLSVTKHEAQSATFYPCFDGNGNIEAYLDSNGQAAAIYQYDAFGNVLSGGGKGAAIEQAKFSHRFSTKYQDSETGLLYYGYRYLDPVTGRWPSRDPIEERGGPNVYCIVWNSTANLVDALGLMPPLPPPPRESNEGPGVYNPVPLGDFGNLHFVDTPVRNYPGVPNHLRDWQPIGEIVKPGDSVPEWIICCRVNITIVFVPDREWKHWMDPRLSPTVWAHKFAHAMPFWHAFTYPDTHLSADQAADAYFERMKQDIQSVMKKDCYIGELTIMGHGNLRNVGPFNADEIANPSSPSNRFLKWIGTLNGANIAKGLNSDIYLNACGCGDGDAKIIQNMAIVTGIRTIGYSGDFIVIPLGDTVIAEPDGSIKK